MFWFSAVSLLTTTTISLDRLLALMLGLRYRQVVTLRRASVFVVTLWLFTTAMVWVAFYNFHIAINIACIVLLIVYCNWHQLSVTRRFISHFAITKLKCKEKFTKDDWMGEELLHVNIARYRKTVSSTLWTQMTLLAWYLPYGTLTAFIAISGIDKPAHNLVWAVAMSLLLLNSSLNPFLYCWKMKEVRKAVNDTIRRFGCLRS